MIKKSFTMIELIFVMVIVGILAIFVAPKFCGDACGKSADLIKAANQVLGHIRYTRHLAMVDNKFQPYPLDSSNQETDRSKYWFKQWWQIYFSRDSNGDNYWYTIFQDIPTNNSYDLDGTVHLPYTIEGRDEQISKDPLSGKYLIGYCDTAQYPDCSDVNQRLNLTKTYDINTIIINDSNYAVGSSGANRYRTRILFDNIGRPYFREGGNGDSGDINPYNWNDRKLLITKVGLELKQGNQCIYIQIEPETGYSYIDYETPCT